MKSRKHAFSRTKLSIHARRGTERTHIFCIHSNHTHKNNNLLVFSRFGWVDTICHCRCRRRLRLRRRPRSNTASRLGVRSGQAAAKVFCGVHFIFYFDSNFVRSSFSLSSSLHISLPMCVSTSTLWPFFVFLFFRVVYFSLLSLCIWNICGWC